MALAPNSTGRAKMPVRMTSKAPKFMAKATQKMFGNSTNGAHRAGGSAGVGRFPNKLTSGYGIK